MWFIVGDSAPLIARSVRCLPDRPIVGLTFIILRILKFIYNSKACARRTHAKTGVGEICQNTHAVNYD